MGKPRPAKRRRIDLLNPRESHDSMVKDSDAPLPPSPQDEPPTTQTDIVDANEIQERQREDNSKIPTTSQFPHEPKTPPTGQRTFMLPSVQSTTPYKKANFDPNTASAYASDDYSRQAERAKQTTIGPIPLDVFLANSLLCPPKAQDELDDRFAKKFAEVMKKHKQKDLTLGRQITASLVSSSLVFRVCHAQQILYLISERLLST